MLLANFEIIKLIKEEKVNSVKNQDLNTLDFEIKKYFTEIPNSNLWKLANELQNLPQKLQEIEILHLINHLPTTLVELNVLIEEFQDRFTDAECNDLIIIIKKYK
jgi:DNA-directed RNA polymerase subunit F